MLSTIVFEIKKFKKLHAFMFVLCLAGVEGGGGSLEVVWKEMSP